MPQTTLGDPGKKILAKFPGTCRECGGDILTGQTIYHSRVNGDRHQRCVDPGPIDAAPEAAAPRDAPRAAARLWSDEAARRWAEGRAPDAGDATPRAARDATAAVGPAADDATQRVPGDATRDGRSAVPEYVAPRRDTEFGRAGDRDAARKECRELIRLQIDFLTRLEKLLS